MLSLFFTLGWMRCVKHLNKVQWSKVSKNMGDNVYLHISWKMDFIKSLEWSYKNKWMENLIWANKLACKLTCKVCPSTSQLAYQKASSPCPVACDNTEWWASLNTAAPFLIFYGSLKGIITPNHHYFPACLPSFLYSEVIGVILW